MTGAKKIIIKDEVDEFLARKSGTVYPREEAWDICHKVFAEAIGRKNKDIDGIVLGGKIVDSIVIGNNIIRGGKLKAEDYDYLALHLYAYLASYGMVCRRTILIRHNYRCLIDVVKIICELKYAFLLDIDIYAGIFNKYKYIDAVLELKENIEKALAPYGNVTDTLISKILLGTLACVPAYDTNLKKALKDLGYKASFDRKGLEDLLRFADYYKEDIQDAMNETGYPAIKIIDIALWEYGSKI